MCLSLKTRVLIQVFWLLEVELWKERVKGGVESAQSTSGHSECRVEWESQATVKTGSQGYGRNSQGSRE